MQYKLSIVSRKSQGNRKGLPWPTYLIALAGLAITSAVRSDVN